MDIFTAIRERRSCRSFLPDPIDHRSLEAILEAGNRAPSAANNQPWEFVVISSPEVKSRIQEAAFQTKQMLFEKSGWKWLERYSAKFLTEAPVLVAVIGDPQKAGAHVFMPESSNAYQHACAAAVQNMLLAAHALGLGSLWFTLFTKDALRRILSLGADRDPVAVVCLGKPAQDTPVAPRKPVAEKTRFVK